LWLSCASAATSACREKPPTLPASPSNGPASPGSVCSRRLAFGTPDVHLMRRLCGEALTDPGNASRTLLLDLASGDWCDTLAERFGVVDTERPRIVPSSGIVARTRGVPELPDGIPIAGMAGDQQAALFGQGCFDLGQAKISYGTGSFVLVNTGTAPVHSRHGLVSTIAWRIGNVTHYALEGGAFVAGALVGWLRDGLGIIERASDVEHLAASVPDNGGRGGPGACRPRRAALAAGSARPDPRTHPRQHAGAHRGKASRTASATSSTRWRRTSAAR
jgi:glycerol kinase